MAYRSVSCLVVTLLMLTMPMGVASDTTCQGDTLLDVCPTKCSCCLTQAAQLSVDCNNTNNVSSLETSLAAIFKKWPSLISVQITRSPLADIESLGLCSLRNLTTLDLSNNKLISIGEAKLKCLSVLQTLNVEANIIGSIGPDTLMGLAKLDTLNLKDNVISEISTRAFRHLKVVTNIWLENNKLESLDTWPLQLATSLPYSALISFSGNHIQTFTNHANWTYTCFVEFPHVDIDLQSNFIRHLIDIFSGWGLKSEYLVLCLFKYGNLKLDLHHNPLVCDCKDFEVYKYIRHVKKGSLMDELFCASPSDMFYDKIIAVPLLDFVCHVTENCTSGCDCVERPANVTFQINCQMQQLQSLPATIPSKTTGYYQYTFKFQLLFRGNSLKTIAPRAYLATSHLGDFSHNDITSIDEHALTQLTSMPYIYLDNNRLTEFPQSVTRMNFRNVLELTLHQNQWLCDCDHKWIKSWLQNMTGRVPEAHRILCYNPERLRGRSILQVPDEDFCSDPKHENMVRLIITVVSSIGGMALLILVPMAVVHGLRVWVYATFKWHPFHWDECDGEDKHFDVFISYSNKNEAWVLDLVRTLEAQGFGTLFHKRDFIGGKPITENVGLAVDRSKRTLCVLTPQFAASRVCMWEFTTALNIDLQENKHRLIAILKEEIPLAEQPTTLRDYLRHFTYINSSSEHFMNNLLYSLPVKKLGAQPDLRQPSDRTDAEGTVPRDTEASEFDGSAEQELTPLI